MTAKDEDANDLSCRPSFLESHSLICNVGFKQGRQKLFCFRQERIEFRRRDKVRIVMPSIKLES